VIKNEEKSEEKEVERLKKELLKRDTELLIRNAKIEVLEKIVERPNVVNNTNNTNNTNITLNMLIDHSMKILSPYEELLEKLPKLITKYVTYEKYKKGIYGITSALIEGILQHEGEKWIVCYDGNKQDFHEKRLGRIEIDQRASYFFDHFTEALKPKVEEFSKIIIDNGFIVFSSKALIEELRSVLKREKFNKYLKFPIAKYIEQHKNLVNLVKITAVYSQSPDPMDNFLFDLAIQKQAIFVVTGDKKLLKHVHNEAFTFITLKRFKELNIS
jgi:putative PIN family toxin of toxin-antitoxin system